MPKVTRLFGDVDLTAAFARTAEIETFADIAPARPLADAAEAAELARDDAEALAACKNDLGTAAWVGAANQETEAQPTLQPKRRRKAPAA